MSLKKIKNNKGFVILFSVVISSIILAIAFGTANIALKEINFGTSAIESNKAFFAADAGIECAIANDRAADTSFQGGGQISCFNINIPFASSTATSWSFVIPSNLGTGNGGCAKVFVTKIATPNPLNPVTNITTTTVTADGYNIGDSSCNSTNANRLERELQATYIN